jgi:hypothetical protein
MIEPGRFCPIAYRTRPEALAGSSCRSVTTLYVVGGLYGNTVALEAVLARAAREDPPAVLVFNGDFHFLDVEADAFRTIATTVADQYATAGNIELELTGDSEDAGCGCGYPPYIDDQTVERSNAVMATLRETAQRFPMLVDPLRRLPRHLAFDVGDERVAIVHGDPENVAGWRLALEALEPPDYEVRRHVGWVGSPTTALVVADWFRRMQVRVLACTHTGLPYAQDFKIDGQRRLVINNGSAGLPNFRDGQYGVITRLSSQPDPPDDSLYGAWGGIRCDALPVRYDTKRWEAEFLASWEPGSPAHDSYYGRLLHGTHLSLAQAARGTVGATKPSPFE